MHQHKMNIARILIFKLNIDKFFDYCTVKTIKIKETFLQMNLYKDESCICLAFLYYQVKIIDESGNITRTGEEGELCVRGYCVFLGYWEDEEKTKEAVGGAITSARGALTNFWSSITTTQDQAKEDDAESETEIGVEVSADEDAIRESTKTVKSVEKSSPSVEENVDDIKNG